MELVDRKSIGYVRIFPNDGIKTADEFFAAIKNATVVDLVHCSECDYYADGYCVQDQLCKRKPEDFCSYGERRNDLH